MTHPGDEIALFFGEGERLFGSHHAATAARAACLLVPPFGHEAIRSHRAFRQLSMILAGTERHVLRFDFSGCGDSFGDVQTMSAWLRDVGEDTVDHACT